MRLSTLLAAAAVALTTVLTPTMASADTGPVLKPGETIRDRGWAAMVVDGDTLRFSHSPNRLTDSYQVIRLLGVQAPEKLPGASGCEGPSAHTTLRALAEGRPVVLASSSDSRSSIRNRRLRTVYVQTSDGSWVDASAHMLASGFGQWMPKKIEPVHNLQYRHIFDTARASGLNMWNPQFCAPGPAADLSLVVQPDPVGDDADRLNDEYVAVVNRGSTSVDVSGWVIRDGSLDWLRLPAGSMIPAGGLLYVHSGSGSNRDGHVYWGRRGPVWANFTKADGTPTPGGFIGDGAYLLDPVGNMRAWNVYPCLGSDCTSSATAQGVRLGKVMYDPPGDERGRPNSEYITITNTTALPLPLFGYEVRAGGFGYEFAPTDVLPASSAMILRLGSGTDSPRVRYLGLDRAALSNSSDRVLLRSFDGARLDCAAWGSQRCPAGYPRSR